MEYVFGSGRFGCRGGVSGLGFTNSVGTWGILDVCLCLGSGGVCGEWARGLDQGLEGWCYVCVSCKSGLYV